MKIISKGVFVLGVWVFVSPWVLGFSSINLALWSNCIAGIILISLSFQFFPSEKNHKKEESNKLE
jgi:hypothetical protein